MNKWVIAIDIGGTKISSAIINEEGSINFFIKENINKEGGYKVIDQVANIIKHFFNLTQNFNYVGIGISIPGIVKNNIVITAPNIKNWNNLPLVELLQQKIREDIPIMLIDDRIAVALGECWQGLAKNKKNVVVIIIGTGVGAGIIINGQPYFGSTGVSGAIGWWITEKNELNLKTEKGFLEEKIAGPAIVKKALNGLKRNKNIKTLLTDICKNQDITTQMVFEAARRGDIHAKEIVKEAAIDLGIAISNIVSILNPEMIIITGGAGKEFIDFSKIIENIVKNFSQPYAAKNVKILFSELNYYSNLLGVAKYVFNKIV